MADNLAEAWPGEVHHWGVIGIGRVQWRMVAAGLTLGGSIRVGLEDNFYLPGGEMARSNGELIAAARALTPRRRDGGRRPSQEARALLGRSRPALMDGMLKMSQLAARSGVSAGTIKHYLREGLLGSEDEIVRTSRNMAWYPESFVERITVIKRLQEERYLPLSVIRTTIADDPERALRLLELEDRILDHAARVGESGRVSRAAVRATYEVPRNVLARLEELGVLTPTARGYDPDDVAIIEAIARFRAGGYQEALGFTVYDTLRYRDALAPLVAEEATTLLARLAETADVDRAAEIVASGAEPLRALIGAMHSKLLLAELRRHREWALGRRGPRRQRGDGGRLRRYGSALSI